MAAVKSVTFKLDAPEGVPRCLYVIEYPTGNTSSGTCTRDLAMQLAGQFFPTEMQAMATGLSATAGGTTATTPTTTTTSTTSTSVAATTPVATVKVGL